MQKVKNKKKYLNKNLKKNIFVNIKKTNQLSDINIVYTGNNMGVVTVFVSITAVEYPLRRLWRVSR